MRFILPTFQPNQLKSPLCKNPRDMTCEEEFCSESIRRFSAGRPWDTPRPTSQSRANNKSLPTRALEGLLLDWTGVPTAGYQVV